MKTILFALFLLLAGNYTFSQTEKQAIVPVVEASYTGGSEAMMNYLQKNISIPKDKKNIQGKVYVEFFVDKQGKVKDVKVLRGLDPKLDEIAVTAVSKMPDWVPAKDPSGAPMGSKMVLPISFSK
ncbi:MAG: transport protein TonB [Crocinitomicaceae bacterium]|nr:transport protein TonB [Crocinitomicaceae bacterium]